MWNDTPDGRLKSWKDFRTRISALPLENATQEVTKLWSFAPFVNHYLDPRDTKEWPGPWQLVYENYYCHIAIGLAMLYTLLLSDHATSLKYEFRIYRDDSRDEEYGVVYLNDGQYILNAVHTEVVNTEQLDKSWILVRCMNGDDLPVKEF